MADEPMENAIENSTDRQADIGEFEKDLRQICPENSKQDNPVILSNKVLDSVAFHDFAYYEYLLPTESSNHYGGLSPEALARIDWMENVYLRLIVVQPSLRQTYTRQLVELLVRFEHGIRTVIYRDLPLVADRDVLFNATINNVYQDDTTWYAVIGILFGNYQNEIRQGRPFLYLNFVEREIQGYLYRRIQYLYPDLADLWLEWDAFYTQKYNTYKQSNPPPASLPAHPGDDYSFEVFPDHSINIGLRLVYRQEWKPLGVQPGEIVRTIPLGPGQKERVTTKITRRKKQTSTLTTTTQTETSTESTDSTKDSNEIVTEAASNFNWNVNAEVHGGISLIGGSVNTSLGGSSEDKSKKTSSHLSEAMQKTAGKIRRETKVVVSMESEETFEREQFSEITNPNNEMAITYEYLKLQQQYQVFTYLAEVESVIFIAEHLPSPMEINKHWIRKHDWIIAKVLKDESYRQTLTDLVQDIDENDILENTGGDPFKDMLDIAGSKFATFEPNTTAAGVGGLTIPDIYSEPQKNYRDHLKEQASRKRANDIREIKWNRLYDHIKDNILHYCQAIWAHEDPEQRMLRYKKENRRIPVEWHLPQLNPLGQNLQFLPTGQDEPVWELIDPTGPLSFVGNYAVFGLRPMPEPNLPDLSGMLDLSRFVADHYVKKINLQTLMARMREDYVDDDGTLLDPALADFEEQARELVRKDPGVLARLNNSEVLDFLSYLPYLWKEMIDENGDIIRDENMNPNDPKQLHYSITPEEWGKYLYCKNGTRRFLVDSNNLYLNIRTGDGVALEPFKRAHRYIDVLKAQQEMETIRLKNNRRATQMQHAGEYDPDIQKVVILGDAAKIAVPGEIHE
ncbi:MAG: hypothetical protein KKE44_01435 [Proteobacteria bacterium]|nr:hypothetical protein [Pseudomonadota bacterium]MBU1581390.1 hypothetical protein [Pseudomonadota bacterium]MBU2456253.1 hypothetical protein [Pseudomonadota bacterium]MBU2628844.1 hypothetical protein [Pseudomonadota bacterium]